MEDLEKKFTHHPPINNQAGRYVLIRTQSLRLAKLIIENCPDSRERSLAITKLEEAVMWANAAIARNEGGDVNYG